jgi:DNA-binding LacI/PurR family transcriptional regulator
LYTVLRLVKQAFIADNPEGHDERLPTPLLMEDKPITIEDVAQRAGVSISTVSNALNGRPERMRKETLDRIESVIAELGFQPNRAARQLKTGHTPLLGLLIPSIENPSYGSLAHEIEIVAQERYGYRVLLGSTYRNREKESNFFDDLLSHGVRGVIVISSLADQSHVHAAVRRGLIAVSYDRRAPARHASPIDYVSMDNANAARLAVEHLLASGHTRLALVTASGRTLSRTEKINGFLSAVRSAGAGRIAKVLERKAQSAFGDAEMAELGRALAGDIAKSRPRPTGIVAINDMLAIGLIAGLRDYDIHVPDEVSVIGMDDLALSALVSPAVTSVRLPLAAMARTMVDRIISRLGDPKIPTGEFLFQPTLVARESVGSQSGHPDRSPVHTQPRTRTNKDAAARRSRSS